MCPHSVGILSVGYPKLVRPCIISYVNLTLYHILTPWVSGLDEYLEDINRKICLRKSMWNIFKFLNISFNIKTLIMKWFAWVILMSDVNSSRVILMLENRVHCMFLFTIMRYCYLKAFLDFFWFFAHGSIE